MKRKVLVCIAAFFLLMGAALLIVPRVSNYVGVQIAHHTVDEFINLKDNIVEGTRPTEQEKESDGEISRSETKTKTVLYRVDIDRLYQDSVAYNEMLKTNQNHLLIDETSYLNPALNLSEYGVPNGVYGYVAAPSINMELPIYLGGNDYNMSLGAAHLTYTSLPIGGNNTNSVLSGHTGYIGRIFFDYIRNLNVGDEVVIENYWSKLTYKVMDKRIYKNYQSSACYLTEGKDLLTMLTCISDGQGGFDRYYVICKRSS